MNLGKLTKRLKKELGANPKQVAALAVVCLVGVWFWWPLLAKWFKPKAAEAVATTAAETPVLGTPAAKEEKKQHSWFEQQAWRNRDPLTLSAALPLDVRDPFLSLSKTVVVPEQAKQPLTPQVKQDEPVAAAPLDPTKLGLILEAVAYGRTRRHAQINGRTVAEKEAVKLNIGRRDEEGEDQPQVSAVVVSIGRDEVVLDVAGSMLRLQLQQKLLGDGELVQRRGVANR